MCAKVVNRPAGYSCWKDIVLGAFGLRRFPSSSRLPHPTPLLVVEPSQTAAPFSFLHIEALIDDQSPIILPRVKRVIGYDGLDQSTVLDQSIL